jgi:hypothetical protein
VKKTIIENVASICYSVLQSRLCEIIFLSLLKLCENISDFYSARIAAKLGVKWEPGSAEQAYNAGQSTQIPVRTIVQLKSRYRGHLSYGNRKLIVEKGINAK